MLRVKAGLFGALCVVASATALYMEARHSLTGVQTSAVLVDRAEECQAEFQPKGESRRKEAMSCQSAYAFRAAVGENKVRVHKTFLSVLRVSMADGSQRTVRLNDSTLNTFMTPVGGSVSVVYNPSNPDDVRLPMTFARVQTYFGMLGLGVLLLGIAFIGPILRALSGALSDRQASQTETVAPELTRGQLALLEARNAQQARAGTAPQQRRGLAGIAAVGGAPRQFGMRS